MRELTFRQRLFVSYYLGEAGGNATDAARKAGYPHPNTQGPRLLVNVRIRAAIDAKLDSVALSADEVLARLSELASSDLGDYIVFRRDGSWSIDLKRAKKARRTGTIRKLKFRRESGEDGTVDHIEIDLYDKLAALDKLARHHGLFEKDVAKGPIDIRVTYEGCEPDYLTTKTTQAIEDKSECEKPA